MIRKMTFSTIALVALLSGTPSYAIVYILQKGYTMRHVRSMLKAKSALKDKVTVNGVEGDMEVFLSPMKISDALDSLKKVLTKKNGSFGNGVVVIQIKGEKWIDRMLLLKAGTKSQVVIFQMRLPVIDHENDPADFWPKELPKPNNAKVERVLQLKRSGAVFCQFSGKQGTVLLNEYEQRIQLAGWSPIVNENGSGGAYFNDKKDHILIFSTWKDGDKSYGSLFLRKTTSLPLK